MCAPKVKVRLAVGNETRGCIGSKRGRVDQRFDMTSIRHCEGDLVGLAGGEREPSIGDSESARLQMRIAARVDDGLQMGMPKIADQEVEGSFVPLIPSLDEHAARATVASGSYRGKGPLVQGPRGCPTPFSP